jgi:hypothetical protein
MKVESVHRVFETAYNNLVVKEYVQRKDEQTSKIYYECILYTYKGLVDTDENRGQNIDIKS